MPEETDESSTNLRLVENKLFFFSDVTAESMLEFSVKFEEAVVFCQKHNATNTEKKSVELVIQSNGGHVLESLSAISLIENCPVPVVSHVPGFAASAATLMSVVANTKTMSKRALMLIHQISSGMEGKAHELVEEAKNVETIMSLIKDIYLEKTKLTKKKLNALLKSDKLLTAEQCLEYGLIDKIV